jgi:hypothetical protein
MFSVGNLGPTKQQANIKKKITQRIGHQISLFY